MRFVDFLKATVQLSAGSATALAALTVVAADAKNDTRLVLIAIGWWLVATVIGLALGRRQATNEPIGRLLAAAKTQTALPEQRAAAILMNRLWPLLVVTLSAGGLAFLAPQISGIAAGFAIIWALAWRRQASAVSAIEQRDGCRFYVERTSPVRPIALTRTPGFRAVMPERLDGVAR